MNCKHYVCRLSSGEYIYSIVDSQQKVMTCKSRIRAQQFKLPEAERIKAILPCEIIEATWERIP